MPLNLSRKGAAPCRPMSKLVLKVNVTAFFFREAQTGIERIERAPAVMSLVQGRDSSRGSRWANPITWL